MISLVYLMSIVMVGMRCGSEIIGNTEYHIRVIELLLQSDRWDEKLPDCIGAPGLYSLLIFIHTFS